MPDQPEATQKEVAAHLLMSPRMVRQYIDEGVFAKPLTLDRCREAYIVRMRETSSQHSDSLTAARIESEKARTESQVLENEARKKTLLPRDQVVTAWSQMLAAARGRFRSVYFRAKREIPELKPASLKRLREWIDASLHELADDPLRPGDTEGDR